MLSGYFLFYLFIYFFRKIDENSGVCGKCGAKMAAYFCCICKHFTNVDKNPYHCEKCGICRWVVLVVNPLPLCIYQGSISIAPECNFTGLGSVKREQNHLCYKRCYRGSKWFYYTSQIVRAVRPAKFDILPDKFSLVRFFFSVVYGT